MLKGLEFLLCELLPQGARRVLPLQGLLKVGHHLFSEFLQPWRTQSLLMITILYINISHSVV